MCVIFLRVSLKNGLVKEEIQEDSNIKTDERSSKDKTHKQGNQKRHGEVDGLQGNAIDLSSLNGTNWLTSDVLMNMETS